MCCSDSSNDVASDGSYDARDGWSSVGGPSFLLTYATAGT